MAIYRLSAGVVKRSKGQSAVAAAAYRAGDDLYDERLDKTHRYNKKSDVQIGEIIAPEGSPEWIYDREKLWNKMEASERQWNGQPAREVVLTLPRELSDSEGWNLARKFVRDEFVSKGMVADVNFHKPLASDGETNPHVHVLLTMRRIIDGEVSKKKERQWNRDFTDGGKSENDKIGGFKNTKGVGHGWVGENTEGLKGIRLRWAFSANTALEENNIEARIDNRSYKDRNIDLEPQKKIGIHAKGRRGQRQHVIATANDNIGDRNEAREYFKPPNHKNRRLSAASGESRNIALDEFMAFYDSEENRELKELQRGGGHER